MLLVLGFGRLAAATFFVAYLATSSRRERVQSLQRAATYGRFRRSTAEQRLQFRERVVAPAADSLAELVLKLNPKTSVEAVRLKLLAAGLSNRITPTQVLAGKGALAIAGLVFGAVVGLPAGAG